VTRLDERERAALNLLCRPGRVLCVTHGRHGDTYCIAPDGGVLTDRVARNILRRPDIWPCEDGLFPGHAQSWRLGPRR
jgi:hypothetical protein